MSRYKHGIVGQYLWVIALGLPVALAALVLVRGLQQPPQPLHGREVALVLPGLVDHLGQPLQERHFAGRYRLIYFGFTRCPDACPTALITLTQALQQMGSAAERIVPVLATVDAERDTPETLRAYVGHFHPRLVGITGSHDAIARLEREFGVAAAKAAGTGGTDDYLVDHTNAFFLVSPQGRLLGRFAASGPPDELADALRAAI